ncbi:MAG: hypothetical protein ACRCST_17625, partial [Turicibacter sp.]
MYKKMEELMNLSSKALAIKLMKIGLIIILVLTVVAFSIGTCISISNSFITGMVVVFLILLSLFYLFLLLCLTVGLFQGLGILGDIRFYQVELKESNPNVVVPIEAEVAKQTEVVKETMVDDVQPLIIKHKVSKQDLQLINQVNQDI